MTDHKPVGVVVAGLLSLCQESGKPAMRRIANEDDIAAGLAELLLIDPRLDAISLAAGDLPLKLAEPGFASLASIVVSQQVSRASADAIMGRLVAMVDPLTPRNLLAAGDEVMRRVGLSRPKQRTLTALATAVACDGLDLEGLCGLEAEVAMARLVAIHGVGPWTAEVYLLFAAGHPDVFPSGDVALQTAVGHALGIEPRPDARTLARLAESWSPWRGIAARLFWAYYRTIRGRDAAPQAGLPATG